MIFKEMSLFVKLMLMILISKAQMEIVLLQFRIIVLIFI